MKKYLFYENLFYDLNSIQNNNVIIEEKVENLEDNSIVILINEKFDILNEKKELFYLIKDNYLETDEFENLSVFLTNIYGKYYLNEKNKIFIENNDLLKQKKIKIVSIFDYIKNLISLNKKVIKEDYGNLFLYSLGEYSFYFYINKDKKISKIGFYENRELNSIINSLIFQETKEDTIIILHINDESKEIYSEIISNFKIEKFKHSFSSTIIENLNSKFSQYLVLYNTLPEKIDNYFLDNDIKSKEIYLKKYYSNIQRSNNIKYMILGGILLVGGGIGYYIQNFMTQSVIDNFEEQISNLNSQLNNEKNIYLKEESKRIKDIIYKKYNQSDKEMLILPYLITYLSHFNLKILSANATFDIKQNKYFGFITVRGTLTNSLINNFNKNIGLDNLDIIPSGDVIKQGFIYVLTFDLKKVYKILKDKKIINFK